MENYEKYETFIEEYCHEFDVVNDHYLDFTDELKFKELNMKIINLIEEHCEKGFKEWSNPEWSNFSSDVYYPIFIKFLKQRHLNRLWEEYNIELNI
tara:strand:- start:296 stop:583 length:288 start_codon:yes stop_codon:yes gene_type:complete